jgi:hypothetical protein
MADYSDDYTSQFAPLNIGSKSALQSQATPSTGLSPELEAATPTAPPGYQPGPTAPVSFEYEKNPLFKLGNILGSIGEDMPIAFKLRAAQMEAKQKADTNKLALDNYYKTNAVVRETARQHNRDMMFKTLEMLPNIIGRLDAISDPKDLETMAGVYSDILESGVPGLGKVAKMMVDPHSKSRILGFNSLMASPTLGAQARELSNNRGVPELMQDPQFHALIDLQGRDTISTIVSRIKHEDMIKIGKGEVSQPEFEKLYNEAIMDESFKLQPIDVAFAKSALHTPYGEEVMAGLHIPTNKMAVAQGKKTGTGNPMNALKYKEFQQNQFKIEHAEELGLGGDEVATLKSHNDRLLSYTAAQSMPGESKTSLHSSALFDLSGGLYQTKQDILDKTPEGSPARKQGLAWAEQATEVQKTASAQSQLGARMQEPAKPEDLSNMFSGKALLSGHSLEPVAPQSTMQLRTNPDNIKVTPDEQIKYGNIIKSKAAGKDLFDMAQALFTAKSGPEMLKQQSQWAMFGSELTAGAGALINPSMKTYNDVLEAWAGNNAKALGGEVGVLTNVDINRWVRTFPGGSDTPTTIAAKRKIFNQMTDLVRATQEQILAGRLSVTRDAAGNITNKDIRQKIEGLLGSAEGLASKATASAQSNTSGKLSPRQKLEQQMRTE